MKNILIFTYIRFPKFCGKWVLWKKKLSMGYKINLFSNSVFYDYLNLSSATWWLKLVAIYCVLGMSWHARLVLLPVVPASCVGIHSCPRCSTSSITLYWWPGRRVETRSSPWAPVPSTLLSSQACKHEAGSQVGQPRFEPLLWCEMIQHCKWWLNTLYHNANCTNLF